MTRLAAIGGTGYLARALTIWPDGGLRQQPPPDRDRRAAIHAHVRACVDTAAPGLGEVDWSRLVDALYEGGFTGVFSVEHEDPVWGGDEDRVETGLRIAHRTLRPLLLA
jgi:sugar phosphate isomerase/epimerase